MEFGRRRRLASVEYPTRLQLYKMPPVQNISLKEFQELANTRLKLLHEVESIRQRSSHEDFDPERFAGKVREVAKRLMPLSSVETEKLEEKHMEERRRDHISHFILRLAYCRTEEMRRWFMKHEMDLLSARYKSAPRADRKEFFDYYKDDFNFIEEAIPLSEDVSGAERTLSKEVYSFYDPRKTHTPPLCCYKVPLASALDLVRTRQVVIKGGWVYVPEHNEDMITRLICNKFRSRLSEELINTFKFIHNVEDDERIAPLLRNIKERYLGEDFSLSGSQFSGKIDLKQMDALCRESFPPCMRHLHEALRKEHHLRHFGRLQYGLFLKSIGLTLEQALAFWRAEFTKKMEADKFDKQYAYNVRHSYGKEGKRANYTPYSCLKVILSNNPGQGDSHGCPFKHWDEEHVRHMLVAHGVSHKAVAEITDYARKSHYQLACQKYFEVTHKLSAAPFSLEHPTQFFIESRQLRGGMVPGGGTKSEPLGAGGVAKSEPLGAGGVAESEPPGPSVSKKLEEEFDISQEELAGFDDEMEL